MTDLQQVALAMAIATRRSLVVIDEFGKGTDSSGILHVAWRRLLANLIFQMGLVWPVDCLSIS